MADYAARWLDHNAPSSAIAGELLALRVRVENTGRATWRRDVAHQVGLLVYLDEALVGYGGITPGEVVPGVQTVISATATVGVAPGPHALRLALIAKDLVFFSAQGTAPLEFTIEVVPPLADASSRLLATGARHAPCFFTPSQRVHRSRTGFAYPLFAERAEGCILTDVDGREFLDVHMGWGCNLLGYSEPRIQAAITRTAAVSPGLLSLPHRLELEVAEMLCGGGRFGDEVIFGKNGSDVTTWAVRTARVATGRRTVLFSGYHGWQDWYAGSQGFERSGVPEGNNRYNVSLRYRDLAAAERAVEQAGGDVAAIVTDPAHASVDLDDPLHLGDGPYLEALQGLARRTGALFVLDEVMTGFRFRRGSAQDAYGLRPDLTCLGKGLANGMALSALVARGDLLRRCAHRIFHAPTMKGEVYSFAAAREALRIYGEEDVPAQVAAAGEAIRAGVDGLCRRLGLDAALIGAPYRMFLRFGGLHEAEEVMARTLLQQELTRRHVISFRGYVILSRRHDAAAVDRCLSAFEGALAAVAQALAHGWPLRDLDIPDVQLEGRLTSAEVERPGGGG